MACENCNKTSKIIFGIAGVLALVGAIVIIVAVTTGSESTKVGFQVENQQNPTLKVENGKGRLGYALHFKASEHGSCDSIKSGTTITAPSGSAPLLFASCQEAQAAWEASNNPPLRKLGHFFLNENAGVKVYGDYTISSSTSLWVVDSGEELGEAVGGIFAAMGIFVLGIVFFVISCIMCCVGCCCMGGVKETPAVVVQGGAQMVGQAQPAK